MLNMSAPWKTLAAFAIAIPLIVPARTIGQGAQPAQGRGQTPAPAPAGRGDAQAPAPGGRGGAQPARGGGRGAAPPPAGRGGASVDITGYWVSVVTEDWLLRMVTPRKGER